MSAVPEARPHLDDDDEAAVRRVFASGQIAAGEEVALFEREFAAFHGLPDAVAVSSGFAALHLALLAVGVRPGDEVVLPCVSSCAGLRDAVCACGAVPVFADTTPGNLNLSAQTAAAVVSTRTRALLCPHHAGIPADLAPILALGLPVVEDCAQAVGALYAGRPVGSWGAAAVFSFYATKLMTTVDGGAVASADAAVTARVRDLRYYGGTWDAQPRFNYKMQNLHAALGRTQLRKLPGMLARRRAIGERYLVALRAAGFDERRCLRVPQDGVYFRFGLRVPAERRAALLEELGQRGVPARGEAGFLCADRGPFPAARALLAELVSLPTYPALRDDDLERVLAALTEALRVVGLDRVGPP